MKNNKGKFLIATLAGAAIGAGLGILYAPYKGKKIRRKIKHAMEDTADDVSGWLKNTKDDLSKTAYRTKDAFDKKLEKPSN